MRNLLLTFLIAFVSTSFVVPEAHAKRFGGGSKIGKSFFSQKKVSPSATKTSPATNKGSTAKKAGLGGLMGGLLAGGILGAMFFGGAFEGIQMMDIILLLLGGFILIKIIAMMRASKQTSYATEAGEMRVNANEFNSNSDTSTATEMTAPQWFNEAQFVKGAKSHFVNLQQAWDAQNWSEIDTYTTADVLAELKQQRAELADDLLTEVVSLEAQLVGIREASGSVVCAVNFSGKIKEDSALVAKDFDETWHLSRDMQTENADWVIAGIEQNSQI